MLSSMENLQLKGAGGERAREKMMTAHLNKSLRENELKELTDLKMRTHHVYGSTSTPASLRMATP